MFTSKHLSVSVLVGPFGYLAFRITRSSFQCRGTLYAPKILTLLSYVLQIFSPISLALHFLVFPLNMRTYYIFIHSNLLIFSFVIYCYCF